jgi:hypothetical protein
MGETHEADLGRTWKYRLLNQSSIEVDSIELEDDSAARAWALKAKIDKGLQTATLECLRGGQWQAIWDVKVATLADETDDQP